MSDPFDSGTTGIALALDVPFPANVTSGPGVKVDKTTGNWKISLDTPPLADGGTPATPSNVYIAAYDAGLQAYEKLRLDNIIAGATGLDSRTPRGDADYIILVGDRYVALTAALTAFRTWTLPPVASVPPGRIIVVQDEAGGITGQNHLNFLPTGADTIDGLANYRLKAKFGGLTFRSDGTSKWSIAYAWQTTFVADTAYTVQQGDLIIAYASLSAPRIVTLPAANAYPAGQRLTVIDYSGACSATNIISITRVGADIINGATSQSITVPYGYVALISDGTSKWTIVDTASINGVPIGATTPSTGAFTTLSVSGAVTMGTAGSLPLRGYLGGLVLSNDGGSPNTVIDIAAGVAQSDDNTATMVLPSAFTKSIAGTWVVGSGSNGLDTGVAAASTWYHTYLIKRIDTGVVDIVFSTSATSPSPMPTNYTVKRRIGSFKLDGSVHILAFTQIGDEFIWATPSADYSTALATSAAMAALGGCPPGVKTLAKMRFGMTTTGGGAGGCLISSADEIDNAPNTPAGNYTMWTSGTSTFNAALAEAWTNTAQQVRVRGSQATMPFNVATRGYLDPRGK